MKYFCSVLALSSVTLFAPLISAAEPDTGPTVELAMASTIETTLITATRTEETLRDTLAPATVINRDSIELSQAKDLNQLLAYVPGVELTQNGGYGANSGLILRGTNSDHTLFLLNGQRFSSATLGSTNFQFISPEQIERIEIVRGPRSSIYGSDAIGGVIQIFTRRGGDDPTAYFKAGGGSHKTYQTALGGSGSSGALHYAGDLFYFDTDGIDNYQDKTPPQNDDDGYRNRNISGNLGYDITEATVLDLNYFETKARNEYDNTFQPTAPFTKSWIQTIQLSLASTLIENLWDIDFSVGTSSDDSDNFDPLQSVSGRSHFRTTRDSANLLNNFQFGDLHRLTVGAEYYDDEVKSSNLYADTNGDPVKTRDNTAGFLVYQFNSSIIDAQLGLRQDDNEEFATHTTGNASLGFHLGASHQLIFSYGEGFKAPTFNDLYWPNDGFSYGNPDLESEESESYEIELRGEYTSSRWALSVYSTTVDNLIDWAPVDPNDPFSAYTPSNVASAAIDGVELSGAVELSDLWFTATASYIDATDDDTGKQLTNRAKQSASLNVDKRFDRWSLGTGMSAYSKRYSTLANTSYTPGYAVVDVYTAYQFSDRFTGELKLNNIFDREYANREGFPLDGFNWFVSVKYSL